MSGQQVSSKNFDSETAEGVALVDFYAEWCGPCKMMTPIVDELATELEGSVKVLGVDVDEAADVATRFGVSSVPTFIVFRDGAPAKTLVGYTSKENLLEAIEGAKTS